MGPLFYNSTHHSSLSGWYTIAINARVQAKEVAEGLQAIDKGTVCTNQI